MYIERYGAAAATRMSMNAAAVPMQYGSTGVLSTQNANATRRMANGSLPALCCVRRMPARAGPPRLAAACWPRSAETLGWRLHCCHGLHVDVLGGNGLGCSWYYRADIAHLPACDAPPYPVNQPRINRQNDGQQEQPARYTGADDDGGLL